MGLDFDKSSANWSYSGFNQFREKLAAAIGINLRQMQGFDGSQSWDTVTSPIAPLLNHSDCDGHLTVTEMKGIAPELKRIVSSWPDGYDKEQALQLVKDMETCIKKKQKLEFC